MTKEEIVIDGLIINGDIVTNYSGNDKVVNIPSNIREIDDYAFSANNSITQIVFQGNSLRKIGSGAFQYCKSLTNIELPGGTSLIADDAFLGCTKMKYAIIPSSVKYISAGVFDKSSGIIIVGDAGTEAERYAERNGLIFKQRISFDPTDMESKAQENKAEQLKAKNNKSIKDGLSTSSETQNAMFYIFAIATAILFVMTAYYWIKTGTFNDAPYATGPYGSNVVHPVNPYRKYVFICGPLACLTCCLASNAKE